MSADSGDYYINKPALTPGIIRGLHTLDLSQKSSDDLIDGIFRNLPDPTSDTLDKEKWNACTRSIMELRSRAIAGCDVTLLGRVHVLIREMETVSQAIAFNAKRSADMQPSLHVTGEVRA